jgi:protein-L-isoaspartate(D-aspartate) O-methyltransferase
MTGAVVKKRILIEWLIAAAIVSASGCSRETSSQAPVLEPEQAGKEAPPTPKSGWERQRRQMVERQLRGRDIRDEQVLAAMGRVPRHEFVPESERRLAYADRPLPIGHAQTISQPYIVAFMTQAIKPGPKQRVLEIGTGSGYQAAVLAELVGEVYTIELIPELAKEAAARLKKLGYKNVHAKAGDGYKGWPDKAPFDAILVTCGAKHVPEPLVEQLKTGGTMVIPVGDLWKGQWLRVIKRGADGKLKSHDTFPVRFVPLRRESDLKAK